MSKSTKKAADQAEREKVHKRYSNRREPDIIYPANRLISMMPTFISVLQSMSEFPQIIWGRKRLMSFRKTIMRSLF